MSDPCKGEGATHFACDCQLERIQALEEIREAASSLVNYILDMNIPSGVKEYVYRFTKAERAYDAKFGEKK